MAAAFQGPGSTLDPATLHQIHTSFAPSIILTSGVELRVFTHIAEGKKSAAEIAQAEGASERGMRMLLDSLTAMQLLRKSDGRYELNPLAAEFLVRGAPNYMGLLYEKGPRGLESWLRLTDIIRKGQPIRRVDEQEAAEEFFPALVGTLHIINREPARRTAQILGAGNGYRGMKVLDVGCGSGVWSIAVAEADPQARITAQDFPGMLAETRQYLARHKVEGQYDFLPGDLKEVDLGESRYDVALLGNIVHSEGESSSRDLFRRLKRALKPGGRVAIIDMIPNSERTGPPFPVFFALNMLVHSTEGDTYTLDEYTAWLKDAGFSRVETADIASHSPLIIGHS
jgi:ubiquinone/menaquinone biosynthesis C-methylase UbiE